MANKKNIFDVYNKPFFNDKKIYTIEDIKIKEDSSVLIVGSRRTGKSILALNLIKHMTD